MKVILATDTDRERWDEYLDSKPFIAPLNRFGWKAVLERSYRVRTRFLIAANRDGEVCGVLPTYAVRGVTGVPRSYSLRFGLVANNDAVASALISELGQQCQEENIESILVTSGYTSFRTPLSVNRKTTLTMELQRTAEDEWEALRSKTRNMIRKSSANGLVVERGIHNLARFYDTYCETMLPKRIPLLNLDFFATVAEVLGDRSELIVAKKDQRVIGGIFVLFGNDIAIYPWQCSLPEFQKFAPNQLLIWEAIKSCIQRRTFRLDMGESTLGGSTYLFKKNFGGTDHDVYYYSMESSRTKSRRRSIQQAAAFVGSRIPGVLIERSPDLVRRSVGRWMKSRGRIV